MICRKNKLVCFSLVVAMMCVASCASFSSRDEESKKAADAKRQQNAIAEMVDRDAKKDPTSLPVQYQTPAYTIDPEAPKEIFGENAIRLKVGARIETKNGKQPLSQIVKGLADLKKMNVSWASDVDQDAKVDVHIGADDDFYEAITQLLRQLDYFHEVQGNTIIIKYKETKRYQIAMPFVQNKYTTGVGGNLLGNDEKSKNIDGTIELKSKDNDFNVWKNIEENLNAILDVWTVKEVAELNANKDTKEKSKETKNTDRQTTFSDKSKVKTKSSELSDQVNGKREEYAEVSTVRARSDNKNIYYIDKPVGSITVTAPRPLQERVENYITSLKETLYKQINIEAKIIEVQLNNDSNIGVNWSKVLKNFAVTGSVAFGSGGQVWPYIFAKDTGSDNVLSADGKSYTRLYDPGRFVSKVSVDTASFSAFLNALNEEGTTKVLSNPKISVMNGQPSLITVGKNVTYIDNIEANIDTETNLITYTVKTNRILSGIGMALTATMLGKDEIIMNMVPVTSELAEPIEYKDIGTLGATVGLPIVNIREMSTTVKVKDGEMLVIGGLISDVEENTGSFAPVLGSIPLVKYLFGNEEKVKKKRELIILLKPRII